jgi:hypothetical protein
VGAGIFWVMPFQVVDEPTVSLLLEVSTPEKAGSDTSRAEIGVDKFQLLLQGKYAPRVYLFYRYFCLYKPQSVFSSHRTYGFPGVTLTVLQS